MLGSAIVSLALAASALATVFLTAPVGSTSWPAGQPATVSWQDDGSAPSLAQFGLADFAVYVGNALQQTPLQTIATYVNVSNVSSVQFTPQASIGPNSGEYFVRVTSHTAMNPSSPQYAEEAFSAKFTLTNMSGSFNSSVQAEIDGQSTAPIGVPTSSSPGATGATPAPTSGTPASQTSSGAKSTSTPTNGAAKPVIATGLVAVLAALVGASFL